MAIQNCEGWAVEVLGDKQDLDDVRDMLPAPFDPWVEEFIHDSEVKLLLRSRTWRTLSAPRDVAAQAARLVDQLNGAIPLIYADAKPIRLGGLMEFDAEGKRHLTLITATANIVLENMRVRGRFVAGGDTIPVAQSNLQLMLGRADQSDHRAELLVHISRLAPVDGRLPANCWFDLYKVAELIKELAGGKEEHLERDLGDQWKQFKDIWRTANSYRHAPGLHHTPPDPPVELPFAKKFILGVALKYV